MLVEAADKYMHIPFALSAGRSTFKLVGHGCNSICFAGQRWTKAGTVSYCWHIQTRVKGSYLQLEGGKGTQT